MFQLNIGAIQNDWDIMPEDIFSTYLSYVKDTEPPVFFHRWSLIASIGAYLGRQYYFQHGHFTIYPNIYCMLMGSPGSRKSTAIKIIRKLLIQANYTTIAADKSTKEKFLMDLAGEETVTGVDKLLDENIFGDSTIKKDAEMFIMADEFNVFFGLGNIEFISLLGTLWDFDGVYSNRIKNSKSININNPTVSILGGNTSTGFSLAFPPEIIGQGFFSRLLLIYGEPSKRRITFPKLPSRESTDELVFKLLNLRKTAMGAATLHPSAEKLLDKIYKKNIRSNDVRFESYYNRRFTHLLKLCLIMSAARYSTDITDKDVVHANTILTHTEQLMPKALGEFGKSRHSNVSNRIVQFLESSDSIVSFKEIWKNVSSDLEKQQDLVTVLQNLIAADKIQQVPGGKGFLPKRRVLDDTDSDTLDYSLLTEEERNTAV